MKRTKTIIAIMLLCSVLSGAAFAQTYLERVTDFADTMLAHGTDRYGAVHSPQLAHALTRDAIPTLLPVTTKYPDWPPRFVEVPNVFVGSNYAHKVSVSGSDPSTDYDLYRMLYLLSDLTGDTQYETAADASLKFFFDNCPDATHGLMPWGEHQGWDFRTEFYDAGNATWTEEQYQDLHEHRNWWPFIDKIAELPDTGSAVLNKYALGIWSQHTWYDGGELRWSRHGRLEGPSIAESAGGMFVKHGGFYCETIAAAVFYAADQGDQALHLSRVTAFIDEYERQIADYGVIPSNILSSSFGPPYEWASSQLDRLSVSLHAAAGYVLGADPVLAGRLTAMADLVYSVPTAYSVVADEDYMNPAFVIKDRDLGKNTKYIGEPGWNIGWDLPGKIPAQHAGVIGKLVDAAIENPPSAPYTSAEYITRAQEIADEAIDLYLEDGTGSPLPRMLDKNSPIQLVDGSSYPAYYHGYTGGAKLMYQLLRLAKLIGQPGFTARCSNH